MVWWSLQMLPHHSMMIVREIMKSWSSNDKRIARILAQVSRFASGRFDGYLEISDRLDEIDAISAGLNQLGDVFAQRAVEAGKNEARIAELSRLVNDFLHDDGGQYRPVSAHTDEIDRLAAGINALQEHVLFCIESSDGFKRSPGN
jgi:hypothetical protein